MQSSSYASPSGSAGHSGSPSAPVQFSLLYQLRHTTCSITARNSLSPLRLSGSSPSLHGPASTAVAHNAQGYATPPRSSTHPTATGLHHYPPVTSSPASSPSAVAPSALPRMAGASYHHHHTTAQGPLLTTMDLRELSKVIVRDAVYARVLDLVPSRQHVQVAVWTLSPHMIQVDGAVSMCVAPPSAGAAGCTTASVDDPEWISASFPPSVSDMRRVLQGRVCELAKDSSLFASILKPYLGEVGCVGDVVRTTVDGVVM